MELKIAMVGSFVELGKAGFVAALLVSLSALPLGTKLQGPTVWLEIYSTFTQRPSLQAGLRIKFQRPTV